jgi:hypothetical protein
MRKVATEFAAAYALLPLIRVKTQIPSLLYVGILVVLHIVVFGAYIYRVQFKDLDADLRSIVVRVAGIAVVVYLLILVVNFNGHQSILDLSERLFVMSVLHSAVIALLMLKVYSRLDRPRAVQRESAVLD